MQLELQRACWPLLSHHRHDMVLCSSQLSQFLADKMCSFFVLQLAVLAAEACNVKGGMDSMTLV